MTYNNKYIENLIDKFFEGKTSNKEEKKIYKFFSSQDIPEHLKKYKSFFSYFDEEIKNDFKSTNRSKTRKIFITSGIAAAISVLIISGILLSRNTDNDFFFLEGSYIVRNGIKITDPEILTHEYEKLNKEFEEQERIMYELFHNIDKVEKDLDIEKRENQITEIKLLSEFIVLESEINNETNQILKNN